MSLRKYLPALASEMNTIVSNNWDPTFCKRKIEACKNENVIEFCDALTEELEVKTRRLAQAHRDGVLSTEIVQNLRTRISRDEDTVEELRSQVNEFKKLEMS